MLNWKYIRRFDWLLLLLAVALTGFGILMIRGIEANSIYEERVLRQTAYAVVGLVAFFVGAVIDYRLWGRMSRVVYVGLLGSLALVLLLGASFGGARSSF